MTLDRAAFTNNHCKQIADKKKKATFAGKGETIICEEEF